MTSYAYMHCKPDGTPFYVGKGALRRAKYFGERNQHHQNIVKKYGKENIFYGVLECSSHQIAYELETGIIKCLKRMGFALTNLTAGGDGGKEPCAETRKRLSEAAKKRGVSLACQEARNKAKRGAVLTEEQKKKQSIAMKGKKFSDAHKANIRKSAKKRGIAHEVIAKAHAANKGRVHTIEEVQKRAKSLQLTLETTGKTTKVLVNGVVYPSMAKAAKAIQVTPSAVLRGLRNSGIVRGHTVEALQ
jgi:hypothetical protein